MDARIAFALDYLRDASPDDAWPRSREGSGFEERLRRSVHDAVAILRLRRADLLASLQAVEQTRH